MTCLNCGQTAGPHFCGSCGQPVDDRRSPLASLLRELVEETFSIDGRTVRTLRALVRPGLITRLYLDGKRVRFLSPLRLYLLASVLLFSSVLALAPPDAREVNLSIAGELVTGPHVAGRTDISIVQPENRTTRWLLARFGDKFAELRRRPPQELLDRLFQQLRAVLPAALFLFLPFLALALKLLYARQHVLYVDHLIVGAHFQSALFLALAVAWGVATITGLSFAFALLLYTAVMLGMLSFYLARTLRQVYRQRWRWTLLKTMAVVLAYMSLMQPVIGAAVFLVLWRL